MPSSTEVVIHQLRQIVVYTFYFCIFQMLIFYNELSGLWTVATFITLLCLSAYEDTLHFDQDEMPEPILTVYKPSLVKEIKESKNYLSIVIANFMRIEAAEGENLPGIPHQMIANIASTKVEFLDDVLLAMGYYLFYFSTFSMFRSLVSQVRYAKHLIWGTLEMSPSASVTSAAAVPRHIAVHHHGHSIAAHRSNRF